MRDIILIYICEFPCDVGICIVCELSVSLLVPHTGMVVCIKSRSKVAIERIPHR